MSQEEGRRSGGNPGAMLPNLARKKRKVSAASRRKMAAAQKRRWAKVNKAYKPKWFHSQRLWLGFAVFGFPSLTREN
jgi:hypothetical protein